MQHSGSGAALGRARDAGRGLPAPTPSPAFAINNTNSSSPGPRGQAKGPLSEELWSPQKLWRLSAPPPHHADEVNAAACSAHTQLIIRHIDG